MYMITLVCGKGKMLLQEFYNIIVRSLLHRLVCPVCGRTGLHIHGYYTRKVKQGPETISLRVCRVKCSACNTTHAVLPSDLVPYSQIPVVIQAEVITAVEAGQSVQPIMEQNPAVDENDVHHIMKNFHQTWEQRLLSVSGTASCRPILDLIKLCFQEFGLQFMQIKRTPNRIFLADHIT